MIFDIRIVVSTITCGLIFLIFGLEEKKTWKIVFGSAMTSVGIIMNMISYFCGG